MSSIKLHATSTALWQELIAETVNQQAYSINEELESYLVFLLMRFSQRPDVTHRVLALDYLQGQLCQGRERQHRLAEVGDLCLLFSGLFPQRAERRRVSIGYYVDLGRSAYLQLANNLRDALAEVYAALSNDFVTLMDILQAISQRSRQEPLLTPLQAFDLWQSCGSNQAYQTLTEQTGALPSGTTNGKTRH